MTESPLHNDCILEESLDSTYLNPKPQHVSIKKNPIIINSPFLQNESKQERIFYRIVYKGIVALHMDIHLQPIKSGSYVSYGDIISSTFDFVCFNNSSPLLLVGKNRYNSCHNILSNILKRKQWILTIPITKSDIGKSLSRDDDNSFSSIYQDTFSIDNPSQDYNTMFPTISNLHQGYTECSLSHLYRSGTKNSSKVVRIDEILTGGFTIDCNTKLEINSFGHFFDVIKQSHIKSSFEKIIPTNPVCTSYLNDGLMTNHVYSSNSSRNKEGFLTHHGYTHHPYNGVIPITERIPTPPLLCQTGTFFYRVISSTPLPIIFGPSPDAPPTCGVALPGTIHEVSLRMSLSQINNNHNLNQSKEKGRRVKKKIEDSIIYLRLSHRRGWIADRRVLTCISKNDNLEGRSLLNLSSSNSVITFTESKENKRCYLLLMEDITNLSNLINHSFHYNVKSCKESISSLIYTSTPGDILRIRYRHIHKRKIKYKIVINKIEILEIVNKDEYYEKYHYRSLPFPVGSRFIPSSIITQSTSRPTINDIASSHNDIGSDSIEKNIYKNCMNKDYSNSVEIDNLSICEKKNNQYISETNRCSKSYIFLMKVISHKGLKILDSPHFQINYIINGSSIPHNSIYVNKYKYICDYDRKFLLNTTKSLNGSFYDNKISNSMLTTNNNTNKFRSFYRSWEFDFVNNSRILNKGTLFEASKRVESTESLYTPGSGLIKLADDTGWAILPIENKFKLQGESFNNQNNSKFSLNRNSCYEEVGNSIVQNYKINTMFDNRKKSSVWMRIIEIKGVEVICPPNDFNEGIIRKKSYSGFNFKSPMISEEKSIKKKNVNEKSCRNDKDIISTIGRVIRGFRPLLNSNNSSFINSVKSPSNIRKKEMVDVPSSHSTWSNNMLRLVIPCGSCVEVDPWDTTTINGNRQDFVRLRGGQGWIPRVINEKTYSVEIQPPNIRKNGSFWFRVISKDGIKVTMGPSHRCKPLKSGDNSYFRFECGEFLRTSEVLTIFGHDDGELSKLNRTNHMKLRSHRQYSEGFAKLYRKLHEPIIEKKNDLNATPLSSLVLPGEWVHIYCNKEVFLEECSHPPIIERHHQGGWWYITIAEGGIEIRVGPSFNAEVTGNMLYAGEKAIVNERVKPSGDIITWLRLKDGQGWVYNVGQNGETVMLPDSL